jgi:hypothetical protein
VSEDHAALAADSVNHPLHYNSHPATCHECDTRVECIDIIEHFPLNIGNAIKYLWRSGLKGDYLEDLKKSIWYIEREIARLAKKGKSRAAMK